MAKIWQKQITQPELTKSTGPMNIEDAKNLLHNYEWPKELAKLFSGTGRGEAGTLHLWVTDVKKARETGMLKLAESIVPYRVKLMPAGKKGVTPLHSAA